MELNLREGCWIKFCKWLQKWYAHIIITICFIPLLMNRYYDRLLPLFRQFLLLPNRNNKFMNLEVNFSTPIPSLYLVKNTNYDTAVSTALFVLFSLCRICQNECPAYFSHIFSICILTTELQSAIFSNRWHLTSEAVSLDMSTYLRHQSFNL